MKVQVFVRLKAGVLDVQGKAVNKGLLNLGFDGVDHLRIGKLIEFEIESPNEASAREEAERICQKLLVNPIMEQYEIRIAA